MYGKGRCPGAVYREPALTAVGGNGWAPADPASGNGWENQALFDHNATPLPAANRFSHRVGPRESA